MSVISRRGFLASGLVAAGSGFIVPPVLAKSVFAAVSDGVHNNRVLVVVQLAGGNDGLNTVVPYADPAYMSARSTIGVHPDTVLHIDGGAGLNPALAGMKKLYDAGQLAIVQGVGYDHPTYSHFEGSYVWQHADPARQQQDGWLGTLLATQYDSLGHPLSACALGETGVPAEMLAPNATVSAIQSVAAYQVRGGPARQAAAPALYQRTPGMYGALLDRALSTAETGIAALAHPATPYKPAVKYRLAGQSAPAAAFADSLQLAAELIVTQPGVKLCHVVLNGFDTHQNEDAVQNALLASLDTALSAFMQDMAAHGQAQRVVLMTWSEFGRRVHENGSRGTDHGAAAPLFLLGAPVRGGLLGEAPSLTHTIDSGNLKYTVDFRSVYQTLIRDWLGGDPRAVLGASFPELALIRPA